MTKSTRTTIEISLMIVPVIFFSSSYFSFAFVSGQDNSLDEYNSIYKYSALENKTSFSNTTNNRDVLAEKLPEATKSLATTAKELQDITEKQNSSIKKTEDIMDALKGRSGLKTFMIGNNLGTLRFQLTQIKDHATFLEALALQTQYSTHMLQIDRQFKLLKEEQTKVEDLILEQKNEFSLFGWLVRMI